MHHPVNLIKFVQTVNKELSWTPFIAYKLLVSAEYASKKNGAEKTAMPQKVGKLIQRFCTFWSKIPKYLNKVEWISQVIYEKKKNMWVAMDEKQKAMQIL